jgi:hypothetical protein
MAAMPRLRLKTNDRRRCVGLRLRIFLTRFLQRALIAGRRQQIRAAPLGKAEAMVQHEMAASNKIPAVNCLPRCVLILRANVSASPSEIIVMAKLLSSHALACVKRIAFLESPPA